MAYIKNIFHAILFSFGQISKTGKKHLLLLLCDSIRRTIHSILLIILPAKIIQQLSLKEYEVALYYIIGITLTIFINEISTAYIKSKKSIMEVDIVMGLNKDLGQAVMKVAYEKLERKSFLDYLEFGKKCIERNSVSKVYQGMIEVISGIFSLSGIFLLISSLTNWLLALILITVVIHVIGEVIRLNYIYTRERGRSDIERNLYYARNELSSNKYAKDIRLYNLYGFVTKKVETYSKALCSLWSKTSMKSVGIIGWTYVVNGIQLVVIYSFLAYAAYNKTINISDFVLYTSSTIGLGEVLKDILNSWVTIAAEDKYIQGIYQIIEKKEEEKDKEKKGKIKEKETLSFHTSIQFKNVSYRYPGADKDTIKNLSAHFVKGKKYAIVGMNGAGKTTFVKLLLGLYQPTNGEIIIDQKSITAHDKKEYWKLFSCVFQDFNIFSYSIRENISFSDTNREDKEMEAVKKAGLKTKVESMANGMDTKINREMNEDGIAMSGGQNQQLAIARAIYKEAEIYVLDEPSAALSPQSEINLYQEFNEIIKGKTAVFISHRLASCRLCDEIIVIDEGRVLEQGSHDELIKLQGLYAKMFKKQAEPYDMEKVYT